jgi:hypothetical protein
MRRFGGSAIVGAALALAGCGDGPAPAPAATPLPPAPPPPETGAVSGISPFTAGCHGTASGTLYISAEVEPFLAVNPANPDQLIGVWQQDRWSNGGARGLLAAASADGGQTWAIRQAPFSWCSGGGSLNEGNYAKATDPWIGIGADGIAYWMSLSYSAQPNAMLVSRSLDGGLSWEAPQTLVVSPVNEQFHDKNSLTADPYLPGHAYAVWDRFDSDTIEAPVWFSRTTDGGVGWEVARVIYDPGAGWHTIGSQIVVLPDGTLVNLLTDAETATDRAWLRVIRSLDRGLTWSTPTTVAEMLWVGTFDEPASLVVRGGGGIGAIAVGPAGTLYVAWQDARFSGGVLDGIALATSVDGGLSWTEPVQVNGAPAADAFSPALAVAADGTVGLTYYDWRENTDASVAVPTAYWLATSGDGALWTERRVGATFELLHAPRSGCCAAFLGDYQALRAGTGDFYAFYGVATPTAGNRSDIRFEALPIHAVTAKAAYRALPAAPFEVTPAWRARIAAQLEQARRHFPDRTTPDLLRRR